MTPRRGYEIHELALSKAHYKTLERAKERVKDFAEVLKRYQPVDFVQYAGEDWGWWYFRLTDRNKRHYVAYRWGFWGSPPKVRVLYAFYRPPRKVKAPALASGIEDNPMDKKKKLLMLTAALLLFGGGGIAYLSTHREAIYKFLNNVPVYRVMVAKRVISNYYPLMKRIAGDEKLAALLAAMACQESRGNPRAVSPAGALGLMQIMPSTANALAGRQVSREELFNPEFSIRLAAKYMKKLLDMFHGDVEKAVAAYNHGEGNVQDKVRRYGKDWKRYLPKETKDYLNHILYRRDAYLKLVKALLKR